MMGDPKRSIIWRLTPEQLARVEPQVDMRDYGYDRVHLRKLYAKHIKRVPPLSISKLRRALNGWDHFVSKSDIQLFELLMELEDEFNRAQFEKSNLTSELSF
jgi:hypothetical protein